MIFDINQAGKAATEALKIRGKNNYKKRISKLEPFRNEIYGMSKYGYSFQIITIHMQEVHKIKVSRSTIYRYLKSIGIKING